MLHDPSVVNYDLLIPWGYGTTYKSLAEVEAILLQHYHPEYVRRLIPWLASKGGTIGVGGTWRDTGMQPDMPGFAAEGRSFHQNQQYADGFIGACAVDLVAPDGPDANFSHDGVSWAMVPPQGSEEAGLWGLHCNVGTPPYGEPWHLQPIEIDGWLRWDSDGRPAPAPDYPLPLEPPAPPAPVKPEFGLYPFDRNKPTVRLGSASDKVKYLQRVLGWLHVTGELNADCGGVDGNFGSRTLGAVRELQLRNGLLVDGIVGPKTWAIVDWAALN